MQYSQRLFLRFYQYVEKLVLEKLQVHEKWKSDERKSDGKHEIGTEGGNWWTDFLEEKYR